MSVRKKLLLLSASPVFVTGGLLLALFFWGHEISSKAYEDAMAWERHARALQNLDWAVRFYFDSVADRIEQDPLPHGAESSKALARARAESLRLSKRFSPVEQAAEELLDAHLLAFVHEGELVGKDLGRLSALAAKYRDSITEEIRHRVEEEDEGSARAIRAANDLAHTIRVGGFAVALLVLVTAVGGSMVAVRGFGGRIASLEEAAAQVAAGHLEGDVPVTSGDELGRLAGSLNAMLEALRRQRTTQLGFLAAVAHDLKNPLGAMRLSTAMLLQASGLPPEPILRKLLALIHRQSERLERMADDLLDATSIEAGELKLTPRACDLAAVVRDVIELHAGTSSRHQLRLSMPTEPVVVVCDPTRVAQVLENLVTNAIKYSPAGGAVDVTLAAGAEEVIVSVADTGLGIEPAMLEAIFEPFRRVSPSKNVSPGVGLGLSICRRIVVAHGGRIDVVSKPGQGTRFQVHLPRQVAAAARETSLEGPTIPTDDPNRG
jgi:signal transduction histidine kinase